MADGSVPFRQPDEHRAQQRVRAQCRSNFQPSGSIAGGESVSLPCVEFAPESVSSRVRGSKRDLETASHRQDRWDAVVLFGVCIFF
jgi:hypothetical protein